MRVRFRDGGPFAGAQIVGDNLFAGYGSSLLSFDISGGVVRYLASTEPLPGNVTDVVVSGGFAFVTTSPGFRERKDTGLFAIDVSEPRVLRLVSAIPFELGATAALRNGNTLYVTAAGFAGGNSSVFAVIDVTDPRSPRVVGTKAGAYLGRQGLAYREGFVYGSAGEVVDIRDPEHPVRVARLGRGNLDGLDIALHGDRAYVSRFGRIAVFDIADPLQPVELGPISLPGQVDYWGALHIEADTLWAAGDGRSLEATGDEVDGVVVRFDLAGTNPPLITGVPGFAIGMDVHDGQMALAGLSGSGESDGYQQMVLNPFSLGKGLSAGNVALGTMTSEGTVDMADPYGGSPVGAWGAAPVGSATVIVDDRNIVVNVREPDGRLHTASTMHFDYPDPFDTSNRPLVGMSIAAAGGRVWTVQEDGPVGYVLNPDHQLVDPVRIPQESDLIGDRLAVAASRLVILHSDSATNSDVLQVFDVANSPPRQIARLPIDAAEYYGRGLVADGGRLFAISEGSVRAVTMDRDGRLSRGPRRSLPGIPGQAVVAGRWLLVPVTTEDQEQRCTVEVYDARSPTLELVTSLLLPEGSRIAAAVAAIGSTAFVLTADSRLHRVRLDPRPDLLESITLADELVCETTEDCYFVEMRGSAPWLTAMPDGGLFANLVRQGTVVVEWTPPRAAFSVSLPVVRGGRQ